MSPKDLMGRLTKLTAAHLRSAAALWRSSPARSSSTVSASNSARASASRSRRPRPSFAAARAASSASTCAPSAVYISTCKEKNSPGLYAMA